MKLSDAAKTSNNQSSGVLSRAVSRAAQRLDISNGLLSKVIGVPLATIPRLYSGDYLLNPKRKEWELALLFVRVFRSLDSIMDNEKCAREWLGSANRVLNGRPLDLISQVQGLVRVTHYLENSRA